MMPVLFLSPSGFELVRDIELVGDEVVTEVIVDEEGLVGFVVSGWNTVPPI